jgi:hypothetical protein
LTVYDGIRGANDSVMFGPVCESETTNLVWVSYWFTGNYKCYFSSVLLIKWFDVGNLSTD